MKENGSQALGEALKDSGFNSSLPSLWVLEGLVYYLSRQHVIELMQTISSLTQEFSGVVHDAVSATFISAGGWHLSDMAERGAPWLSGEDDYAGLWARFGFNSTDVLDLNHLRV